MWRDSSGQGRLVSLDDPGRLLQADVRAALIREDGLRSAIKSAVDDILPGLLDTMELFTWSDDESRFEQADPPREWWVPSEVIFATDPLTALRDHLDSVPLRWRLDIAMTLMMFVTLDADVG